MDKTYEYPERINPPHRKRSCRSLKNYKSNKHVSGCHWLTFLFLTDQGAGLFAQPLTISWKELKALGSEKVPVPDVTRNNDQQSVRTGHPRSRYLMILIHALIYSFTC